MKNSRFIISVLLSLILYSFTGVTQNDVFEIGTALWKWGTYIPTSRSIAGGAYGAVPASTPTGSEKGQQLVGKTLEIINNVIDIKN